MQGLEARTGDDVSALHIQTAEGLWKSDAQQFASSARDSFSATRFAAWLALPERRHPVSQAI